LFDSRRGQCAPLAARAVCYRLIAGKQRGWRPLRLLPEGKGLVSGMSCQLPPWVSRFHLSNEVAAPQSGKYRTTARNSLTTKVTKKRNRFTVPITSCGHAQKAAPCGLFKDGEQRLCASADDIRAGLQLEFRATIDHVMSVTFGRMNVRLSCLIFFLAIFFGFVEPAAAKEWRRARGVLYVTSYRDSRGNTEDDMSLEERRLLLDLDLRNRANNRGVKSSCRDTRRLNQRTCLSTYLYEISGEGQCTYQTRTVLYNFSSRNRNIYAFIEAGIQCPTGYLASLTAEGEIRRS
jgi:hypothetical protein